MANTLYDYENNFNLFLNCSQNLDGYYLDTSNSDYIYKLCYES